ncbi:hypothetical protein QQP08_014394 [Theobroma cacao]|uniref:Uncharacterized protein n=1 Tax=Theobroma cacao TaxID=3641 RepID=A0A061EVJ9_THECC|nr:Uncharacterized protein TCM_021074 [Theobroma cacao]WRX21907.1 hypothetical protein QQP08_014394 [Theobroma cacao]
MQPKHPMAGSRASVQCAPRQPPWPGPIANYTSSNVCPNILAYKGPALNSFLGQTVPTGSLVVQHLHSSWGMEQVAFSRHTCLHAHPLPHMWQYCASAIPKD